MKDKISEIMKNNKEVAQIFSKIEMKISSLYTVKEVFETLLIMIEEEFTIPFVWISITDDDKGFSRTKKEISDLIRTLHSSEILKDRLNIIGKTAFLDLIAHNATPLLVNSNLKPFYRLLPQSRKFLFKSLAIAPIALNGDIIGSFNHGDFSVLRYQPGMNTSMLKQLAANVSSCLSKIMVCEEEGQESTF
ncbi:MAG: hypothetical protein WC560_06365 [Syntrophales bacterium]